jgi:hypothetical protein
VFQSDSSQYQAGREQSCIQAPDLASESVTRLGDYLLASRLPVVPALSSELSQIRLWKTY